MTQPAARLAAELRRRGLDVPARLLADAHRPLAPLLADLGAAIGPLAGAVGGTRFEAIVRDEMLLDRLVDELATGEDR